MDNNTNLDKQPKKKGRKPKNYYLLNKSDNDISINTIDTSNNIPKKRGRKPKGGKICITKNIIVNDNTYQNIILHLNCKINDIDYLYKYNPDIESINGFNFNNKNDNFENIETYSNRSSNKDDYSILKDDIKEAISLKSKENINNKIKNITNKINLLDNGINKSNIACFWCTYEFNSTPVFIPKNIKKSIYNMYGNFCSLECACGFLLNENMDSSVKFERYAILNNLYNTNNNNIKPAPSPYYTLDKYYGNLSIEEYRDLHRLDKFMLILDKPISKIIPEIFQENINNNFIFKK